MEPAAPRRAQRGGWAALAVAVALLDASLAGWLLWPSPPAAPAFQIEAATEQQIRDHVPTSLTVFRFSGNPHILVLDFASLREQGKMLNRVAALVEKKGLPHDRVLSDSELERAIQAYGDTDETFYYGHDYSAASLARFFALADRGHVALDAEESRLRALLDQEGWFAPGIVAGLISLPAAGADGNVTKTERAAILRHELSHGEFFSNPAFADYVRRFWSTELSGEERDGMKRFLAGEDYDDRLESLMCNEMQAYLMFTRDPNIFIPEMAGLSAGRASELRAKFLGGMPAGWLRDVLASYR